MNLSRRGFFGGLLAVVAAPAIVRVESLMALPAPQKIILPEVLRIRLPNDFATKNNLLTINEITREAVRLFQNSNAFIRHLDQQYEKDFAFATGEQWPVIIALRPPQLTFAAWARKVEASA